MFVKKFNLTVFVATKVLSRQKFCRDRSFVATKVCSHKHTFLATNKCFVATKMILAARPADDSLQLSVPEGFNLTVCLGVVL